MTGIASVRYQKRDRNGMVVEGRVYVRDVLTHCDYDKGAWTSLYVAVGP